jgi:hypothetical protein
LSNNEPGNLAPDELRIISRDARSVNPRPGVEPGVFGVTFQVFSGGLVSADAVWKTDQNR